MTSAKNPHHPATAWVDLDRIRDNYRALRAFAGARAVIPVLKADAYGHGAVAVARALEPLGASMLAVAYVGEAIALRQAGVSSRLLVLTGFAPAEFEDVLRFDLTPVVSTAEQVATMTAWTPEEDGRRLKVHVKVDTGMGRLGFTLGAIEPVIHRLEDAADGAVVIEGLMTHLASADEDEVATTRQLDQFEEAIIRLQTLGVRPPLIHAANSAGLAFLRDSHTAVRPGLLLYGVPPRPLSPDIQVAPALEIRARVALVKTVPAGTPISYGGRFVTERESRIATINVGYADGVPRTDNMRTGGYATLRGRRAPVAGTVCMDLTTLDVTDADAGIGDEITVLGPDPGAWDLARWAGTNAWQVLTGIGARIPRRYDVSERRNGGQARDAD